MEQAIENPAGPSTSVADGSGMHVTGSMSAPIASATEYCVILVREKCHRYAIGILHERSAMT